MCRSKHSGLLSKKNYPSSTAKEGLPNSGLDSYSFLMAWGFRRSLNFGPLRVNASKSGLGYSVGGRGFRIGKDARGRKYTSASIPGTGVYNRTYLKGQSKTPASGYTPTVQQSSPNGHARANGKLVGRFARLAVYGVVAAGLYVAISFLLHLL